MDDPHPETRRKSVSLPADVWQRVEDYRFGERIQTEAEALRRLIEQGLEAVRHRKGK